MKPGVMMVSDRTLRNFRAAVRRRASLERYVDSVNSYLGLLQGFAAYGKKLEQLPEILSRLRGRACLTEHMNSIHIYKRFTRREAFRRQVRQARRDFQTYQFATV